jgi:Lytic transglycolase
MKATRNRHGRKDDLGRARADGERAFGSPKLLALLGGALACLALAAVPARAGTGGASATSANGGTVPAGRFVFSSPMRAAGATWYGPGLYGNHTACGQTLRPGTVGVAHRTLPCGTTIKFAYHGRRLVTRVIDRGPYTAGNDFDLTNGARRVLRFEGVGTVRYAVAVGRRKSAR